MRTSKQIAAHIAAKKALMFKELRSIDLSVKPGGITVHLYGKGGGRSRPYSMYEAHGKIVKSQSTIAKSQMIDADHKRR